MPLQRRERVLDRACLLAGGLFECDMQDDIPDIEAVLLLYHLKQQFTGSMERGNCGKGPFALRSEGGAPMGNM